jgi:hypothetical protein
LGTVYRGDLDWLDDIVQVCAHLLNMDLERRPLRARSKFEMIAECENFAIVQNKNQYENIPAIKQKLEEKKKKQQLVVGDHVFVWFDDRAKCYRGKISRVDADEDYLIEWVDQHEPDELLNLSSANRTKDKQNPDRWWRVGDKL